ncbi:MAG TPA: PilZ domain-containing protein [Pyrinomonadaceae bacterium]|jgi:hypothetical protein
MVVDKRRAERILVNLNARWEGVLAQHEGTIVDISSTGCFILTADEVMPRELIRIEIQLPTDRQTYTSLWGEVVYQISEMGFALRFTGSTEAEEKMLNMLMDYIKGRPVVF